MFVVINDTSALPIPIGKYMY